MWSVPDRGHDFPGGGLQMVGFFPRCFPPLPPDHPRLGRGGGLQLPGSGVREGPQRAQAVGSCLSGAEALMGRAEGLLANTGSPIRSFFGSQRDIKEGPADGHVLIRSPISQSRPTEVVMQEPLWLMNPIFPL